MSDCVVLVQMTDAGGMVSKFWPNLHNATLLHANRAIDSLTPLQQCPRSQPNAISTETVALAHGSDTRSPHISTRSCESNPAVSTQVPHRAAAWVSVTLSSRATCRSRSPQARRCRAPTTASAIGVNSAARLRQAASALRRRFSATRAASSQRLCTTANFAMDPFAAAAAAKSVECSSNGEPNGDGREAPIPTNARWPFESAHKCMA